MNAGGSLDNSIINYYDSDYPSAEFSVYPENFDEVTKYQGLAHDVQRYQALADEIDNPILELCCGTGRVAIPLARRGHQITACDLSSGMLARFTENLQRESLDVQKRITLVEQNIVQLDLAEQHYQMAIIAFNSLLCITEFADQCRALTAINRHLVQNGLLVIDIVNPLRLNIQGDAVPKPFFTRKNPHNGNMYTRFAMMDAFDEQHRQRLHGWYDEVLPDGLIKRQYYSLYWRPIFRYEIELMLKAAGFALIKIEGGHQQEAYTAQSPRMFIQARKC